MKKKLETPHVVSYWFEKDPAVKNLILAMNGEKPIAQVNPEVPVKKVV
jgi:D-3-phosphoglycerate dehydrogenase